jgi:hypothetical protein
MKKAWLLPEF